MGEAIGMGVGARVPDLAGLSVDHPFRRAEFACGTGICHAARREFR
ncbi:hypothetical protein L3Q65_16835 [Amycolatopsis sp. FU40]|nr:hypothetical protein [Amycolatopsis sp. FU40]UKD58323.1 hypothetical protein L3Q65_16835 [Amycolatopsis sp. FU40]